MLINWLVNSSSGPSPGRTIRAWINDNAPPTRPWAVSGGSDGAPADR